MLITNPNTKTKSLSADLLVYLQTIFYWRETVSHDHFQSKTKVLQQPITQKSFNKSVMKPSEKHSFHKKLHINTRMLSSLYVPIFFSMILSEQHFCKIKLKNMSFWVNNLHSFLLKECFSNLKTFLRLVWKISLLKQKKLYFFFKKKELI